MKINEFKTAPTEQVDEALSDWIGDTGSAMVKGMFTGKGVEQQMTQDIFIKDFTRDAFTSIDNGIKSGLINPNSGGGTPAAPAAPAAPGAATKRPGLGGRVQQNLNNLRNPAPGAAPAAAPAKPTPPPGAGGGANYTAGQSPAVNLRTAPAQKSNFAPSTGGGITKGGAVTSTGKAPPPGVKPAPGIAPASGQVTTSKNAPFGNYKPTGKERAAVTSTGKAPPPGVNPAPAAAPASGQAPLPGAKSAPFGNYKPTGKEAPLVKAAKTGPNLGNKLKGTFGKIASGFKGLGGKKGKTNTGAKNNAPRFAPDDINESVKRQNSIRALDRYVKVAAEALNLSENKLAVTRDLIVYMASDYDSNLYESAGTKLSETWRLKYCNKLLEATGITWQDLGYKILKENSNYYIAETTYGKLNRIMENIVLGEDGNQESIEQYLMSWYQKYMQGVDWNSRKPNVEAGIKAVADSYSRDKGKQALTKLAQLSYTISKTSGGVPKGIEQDLAAMKKDGGAPGGGNAPGGGSAPGGAGGASSSGSIRKQADNIIHDIQTQHNEDQPALVNYLRKRLDQSFPAAKRKVPTKKPPVTAARPQGKPNLTSVKK